MYGIMEKAKYVPIGLMLFCLVVLTAPAAIAQDVGSGGGSLGESGTRTGTAGATELLVPLTARSTALGSATASGLTGMGGLEALFANPAGLALNTGTEAMFSRLEYVANIGVNYVGIAQTISPSSSIALTIASWDFGNDLFKQTEVVPEISSVTFDVSYVTAGLTYAKQLTDRISAGTTIKIISESIDDVSASTFAFDAGMTYVVGESGLRMGVALKNVGTELQYSGNGLIRQAHIGDQEPTANNNALAFEAEGVQLPTLLNFGAAYSRNLGAASVVTFLGNFRSNSSDQDQYSLAVEYGFQDLFYLRGGYQMTEDRDKTMYTGASYGAGLALDFGDTHVKIDYAIVPVDFFSDNLQYFTVTVGL